MTSTHLTNLIDFGATLSDNCTHHIIWNVYLLGHLTTWSNNCWLDTMWLRTNRGALDLRRLSLVYLSYSADLGLRLRLPNEWLFGI